MKVITKKQSAFITLAMMMFNVLVPFHTSAGSQEDEIVYPIQEISKLECRFQDFDTLSSSCKTTLPILNTKDYNKYATQNGWYNDFTRIYTVLWGSSYKYGWDVGSGWHQGTDIATAKWTPVYSIANGKVIEAGSDVAWGKYVSIEHTIRGQKVISNYAHLSKIQVNKGQSVDVSDKIWEVWSTWNSTGNHLHFQIDLPSTFHPYYYDWNSCPYSYYEITEKGVCFDELTKNTFDPLAFLETNGAIIEDVEIKSTPSLITKPTQIVSNPSSASPDVINSTSSIFNTTVHYGIGTSSDVEKVQEIYRKLWYYNGQVSGNFSDVEASIIKYQITSGVIENSSSDGAGWFGPKTRTQTQKDYELLLTGWAPSLAAETTLSEDSQNTQEEQEETQVVQKPKMKQEIQKVSREKLLTREEIEAQEVEEFLRQYEVEIKNQVSQIESNTTEVSQILITNSKWKGLRGNTPGVVSFKYDNELISIFPETFYNFSDGFRDIKITWKKSGFTTIEIKIGETTVKKIPVTIGKTWEKPTVSDAILFWESQAVITEEKRGLIVLKDQYGNALIWKDFAQSFSLQSDNEVEYCIKKWRLQDIKEIYKRSCFPEEYTKDLNYTYADTIHWVLVFNYKILDQKTTTIKLTEGIKEINKKVVSVSEPKDLENNYKYYNEVVQTLDSGISDGVKKWYFRHDKSLSQKDAKTWITNVLRQSWENISLVAEEASSSFEYLTREQFLQMIDRHFNNNVVSSDTQDYRDLQEDQERLVANILWSSYNWKDDFWESYFQPQKLISRWEATYMLMRALELQWYGSLARQ